MNYTYILLSKKDHKLYVGWTSNLKLRKRCHDLGQVVATRDRRPLELVYYEACVSEGKAVAREKYFKTGFGRKFLKV